MEKPTLSIIGLGKLGSPMVSAYASKGYKIIGVDLNIDFVKAINEKQPPVFEPNLAEYLKNNKERISATQDYKEAVLNSDITFIIVPTPSKEHGGFSTQYAAEAAKETGKVLKEKKDFHIVVLTSTVTPGSTERDLLPVLKEYSGKKCGRDFGLCYNPEFIALGNVIHDLLNPDFVLIGESDKKSGDILEEFYKNILENEAPVKRMSIINAEITKIALNTFVTTKISYANMLAELCEKIPGGNVDVVTDALGCDKRIGSKYLKGGMGYGGPCFPRDNRALNYTAQSFGITLPLAEATDEINKNQVPKLVKLISAVLPPNGRVGVLGLSYKPNTNVVEESQSLEIPKVLIERNIPVMIYDPAAMENTKKILGEKVEYAVSSEECIRNSDVIVLATPWEDFKLIQNEWFKKGGIPPVLIDCWRILKPENYPAVRYFALGINHQEK